MTESASSEDASSPREILAASFWARLRDAESVSAFCHEQPDGDTLGAAVAIALVAGRLGKPAEVVSVDGVPPGYRFLAGADLIRREPQLPPGLAVVCDAATFARVGSIVETHAQWFADATIVNIDHHATNSRFGALNIVDEHAAATCEVIAELLADLEVDLDVDIATALLTGLIRDSHGFSTSSTTPRTLISAAATIAAGASIDAVYRAVLHELPIRTMELWARLLQGMRTAFDDQVIYAVLTPGLLAETGTQQHDADGLVEFLARGQGARIAILFREIGTHTRVSLRTRDGVDATAIAGLFAGGGHRRRAGCTVTEPAERAVELVLDACRPYVVQSP